jgi:hypothetical protein
MRYKFKNIIYNKLVRNHIPAERAGDQDFFERFFMKTNGSVGKKCIL